MDWDWAKDKLRNTFFPPKQIEQFDHYCFYFHRDADGCRLCKETNVFSAEHRDHLTAAHFNDLVGYQPRQSDSIRVIVISDTHEGHDAVALPPCDLLIHAGDIFISSNARPDWYNARMLRSFSDWFQRQPAAHRVIIAGNHDDALQTLTTEEVQQLFPNATLLCNSGITVLGLRIWGTPLSAGRSNNRAYQTDAFRSAALTAAALVSEQVDILITHGHCSDVRDVVRPGMLHVMGHLHEHHGCYTLPLPIPEPTALMPDVDDRHVVIAAAPLIDMEYKPTHHPVVVDCCFCRAGGCEAYAAGVKEQFNAIAGTAADGDGKGTCAVC